MEARTGHELIIIEDQQQKTCLGGDLWALQQQNYFTDLSLIGSDSKKIRGHLCVIAVASPLVKNHAVDGIVGRNDDDGKLVIPIPNFASRIVEHFVSFAYRGQVSIPAEEVRELYRLADYFMDIALQTAITNTVGSVPANIPNIAEVLTKAEDTKDVDMSAPVATAPANSNEWKKAKNVGRRKGRPPKKSHWIVENNSNDQASVQQQTEQKKQQVTRIKRKSAVDATEKWKAESIIDDDEDEDDDSPDTADISDDRPPLRRRLLHRRAKTRHHRGRPLSSPTSGTTCAADTPQQLEWVDGKPSTMCKQCQLTICQHRISIISPEELDYHIREEGGLVVDAGDAVQQGIDALLSMAAGDMGHSNNNSSVGTDRRESERTTDEGSGGEQMKVECNDNDGKASQSPPPHLQVSPLRAKYKLWVDPATKKTKKLYPCEHCGNLYLSLARLIRHIPMHTGVFPFQCPLCTAMFKTKDELTKHDRRKHQGMAAAGLPGAEFQCRQCGVAYNTEVSLKKHTSNHGNDTRQPKANYVLKRKPESNRLVRTYPCSHCTLEFNKASDYEGHLSTHTGIKLYQCRLCNKRFGMEGYLKKHMLRHVEEKSYICALCGAAFKTSSGLYTHEHSVHIDTKPFPCEICGKDFKMKWSMKEHLRMAHSEYVLPKGETSDWQCSTCGAFLPSDIMFKIHEKLHVTDKPFKCRLCTQSFKYRAARLSHERRDHAGVQQDPRLVMPRTLKSAGPRKRTLDPLPPPMQLPPPAQMPMQPQALPPPVTAQPLVQQQLGKPPITISPHYMDNIYYPPPPPQSDPHPPALPQPSAITPLPPAATLTQYASRSSTPSHTPTPLDYQNRPGTGGGSSSQTPSFSGPAPPPPPTLPVTSAPLPPVSTYSSVPGGQLYDSSYYVSVSLAQQQQQQQQQQHDSQRPHSVSAAAAAAVAAAALPSICSICNLTFESQAQLWNHMVVHNIM